MFSPPPSPSDFPPTVTLVRRVTHENVPVPMTTVDEIEAWLFNEAMSVADTLALVDAFAWRLAMAGLGVERLTVHTGTLHPQAIGFSWMWLGDCATCDEIRISPEAPLDPSFRHNPLYHVTQFGEVFRAKRSDPVIAEHYDLIATLAVESFTEFVGMPIGPRRDRYDAVTFATRRPGGFPPDAVAAIERLLRILALHLQHHVAKRIGETIVRTYLGPAIGRRIIEGQVRRYMGETDEIVLWFSDLRGFTALSGHLAPDAVLTVLNAYFEVMVDAIREAGGEVLKFIGDGLLAGFGARELGGREGEARAALAAARNALAGLSALNTTPPPELARIEGWAPLRTGIALHCGESFFGNVGAPDRLDFTVIGHAVNVTSRVESLSAFLGREILVTDRMAALLGEPVEDLGCHRLKGIDEPVRVFAPTR